MLKIFSVEGNDNYEALMIGNRFLNNTTCVKSPFMNKLVT